VEFTFKTPSPLPFFRIEYFQLEMALNHNVVCRNDLEKPYPASYRPPPSVAEYKRTQTAIQYSSERIDGVVNIRTLEQHQTRQSDP
jgi:hypothetical protein